MLRISGKERAAFLSSHLKLELESKKFWEGRYTVLEWKKKSKFREFLFEIRL